MLTISRGGGYGPGTPRDGWDHGTPYLRRFLGDVFGLDLHVAEAELTMAAVNPAMAALRDLAAASSAAGHELAARHGATVGQRLRS